MRIVRFMLAYSVGKNKPPAYSAQAGNIFPGAHRMSSKLRYCSRACLKKFLTKIKVRDNLQEDPSVTVAQSVHLCYLEQVAAEGDGEIVILTDKLVADILTLQWSQNTSAKGFRFFSVSSYPYHFYLFQKS